MSNVTLDARFLQRNDLAATWASKSPIMLKGEMGVEIDTGKFKFGDGTTEWNNLEYSSSTPAVVMTKNPTSADNAYDIGTVWINTNQGLSYILVSSDPATWKPILYDHSGITVDDIPTLPASKISGLGTAATLNSGSSAGNVVVVDSNGKIDESLIPAIAITDTFEVSSEAAMLALTCQKGDVAIRSDLSKSFILKASPASTLANWVELRTPGDAVQSVNGKTGAVTLKTTDVAEGTNQYYTEARATTNFNTNFAKKSAGDLSNGSDVLLATDTYIFNGGTA